MKTVNELCDIVRETAYAVHVFHGQGHLEKVYENALAHRLRKRGLAVKPQHPIKVLDEDGTPIGGYLADPLVENSIFVELKSTKIEHGLLINFGSHKFQIKKYALSHLPRPGYLGGITALILAFSAFFCG
jgi:hypothetical protein